MYNTGTETNPKNDSKTEKVEVVNVAPKTPEGDAAQKTCIVTSVIALLDVLIAVFAIGNSRKISAQYCQKDAVQGMRLAKLQASRVS